MTEIAAVDRYCDLVPRSAATAEEHGSLLLFVPTPESFHPWYARPSGSGPVTAADLQAVLRRQQELDLPRTLEWVSGRPDGLEELVVAVGMALQCHPLLVAEPDELLPFTGAADVRLVGPTDNLGRIEAVAAVGFSHPGTSIGTLGTEALDAVQERDPVPLATRAARVRQGRPTVAAAWVDGEPVSRGGHTLVDDVTEITAVATLPAYRRRGLGSAVTAVLAEDAVRRGARLVWMSAKDGAVARVYSRLGFREVGTACSAEF